MVCVCVYVCEGGGGVGVGGWGLGVVGVVVAEVSKMPVSFAALCHLTSITI